MNDMCNIISNLLSAAPEPAIAVVIGYVVVTLINRVFDYLTAKLILTHVDCKDLIEGQVTCVTDADLSWIESN